MENVGVFEAKTNLSHILERVAAGEEITISKRGVPIAILSPIANSKSSKMKSAVAALKKFRKGRSVGCSMKDLVEEGRKY